MGWGKATEPRLSDIRRLFGLCSRALALKGSNPSGRNQGIETKTTSDGSGLYTLPSLAVGKYALRVEADGFKPQGRKGLSLDLDSALVVDIVLELDAKLEEITEEDVRP